MWRNNSGFMLIDSVYAMLILLILCLGVIPLYLHIYLGREAISHEQTALDQLKTAVVMNARYNKLNQGVQNINGQSYDIYFSSSGQDRSLCVKWLTSSQHRFVKCVEIFNEQ